MRLWALRLKVLDDCRHGESQGEVDGMQGLCRVLGSSPYHDNISPLTHLHRNPDDGGFEGGGEEV